MRVLSRRLLEDWSVGISLAEAFAELLSVKGNGLNIQSYTGSKILKIFYKIPDQTVLHGNNSRTKGQMPSVTCSSRCVLVGKGTDEDTRNTRPSVTFCDAIEELLGPLVVEDTTDSTPHFCSLSLEFKCLCPTQTDQMSNVKSKPSRRVFGFGFWPKSKNVIQVDKITRFIYFMTHQGLHIFRRPHTL